MNYKLTLFTLTILVILLLSNCKKEDTQCISLSQCVIGTWEEKEVSYLFRFNDTLWHRIEGPPYTKITFSQDSLFSIVDRNSKQEEGNYYILDSLIHITTNNFPFTWKIIDFEENQLSVIEQYTHEGPLKVRFYRTE